MGDVVITRGLKLPDSIESVESTGAKRSTQQGKGRPDLISPLFEARLADHLERGAEVYGEDNWTKGIPMRRSLAALLRHIRQWRQGFRDEDHLAAATCNLMFLMHTEEAIEMGILPEELNNIQNYMPIRKETPP